LFRIVVNDINWIKSFKGFFLPLNNYFFLTVLKSVI
jgi:hypothetical protein